MFDFRALRSGTGMLHWSREAVAGGFSGVNHRCSKRKRPLAAAFSQGRNSFYPPIFRIAFLNGLTASIFGVDLACFQQFVLS
jgi:hypothetical protein